MLFGGWIGRERETWSSRERERTTTLCVFAQRSTFFSPLCCCPPFPSPTRNKIYLWSVKAWKWLNSKPNNDTLIYTSFGSLSLLLFSSTLFLFWLKIETIVKKLSADLTPRSRESPFRLVSRSILNFKSREHKIEAESVRSKSRQRSIAQIFVWAYCRRERGSKKTEKKYRKSSTSSSDSLVRSYRTDMCVI